MVVGVLALQGDFAAHVRILRGLGAEAREVRVPADLEGLDGLIIPGGESTTMTLGVEREGLADAAARRSPRPGKPVLGTCAGMIMLDREHLGIGDWLCRRNAFGRQIRSFEDDLAIDGFGDVSAVFIRAPWVSDCGEDVEVLCAVDEPSGGRPAGQPAGDRVPSGDRGGRPLPPMADRALTRNTYAVEGKAVLFLASDDARHITGAMLPVDGDTSASTGQPHL